ncbi:MAG: glycoside hydrolase family 44 protein, partial [Acidobacteriota bacterium]
MPLTFRRSLVLAAVALTSFSHAGAGQRQSVAVNANPPAIISVDAALNRHAIDPRIYGVAFADPAKFADLGITLNRWGGNAVSRHNWAISTTNRAKDFFFENQPDPVSAGDGSNGKAADDFIGPNRAAGVQSIMTIPLMGMLPFDRTVRCGYSIAKYGAQEASDPTRPDCGNGRVTNPPPPPATLRLFGNDPTDTSQVFPSSHQGDWIQHLMNTWGTAANGGVRYYALDNEPSLWSFDHWDVHPTGSSYDEVWGKMAEYGALIKAKDPTSLTTGIEEWGWSGYFASGLDQENYNTPNANGDLNAHGGVPYGEWLLQQARAYEQANGVRILDLAALHFYPQSGEFDFPAIVTDTMQRTRNRSTRSLWDPNYVDESWIGGTGIDGGHVRLIPRLKEWVANDYPGTKIGITEYNWGAENHINGATAQADILGIFGREALDLGVRWTAPPNDSPVYRAIQMYRNYDGASSTFGDQSVSAGGPNPDDVSTFAAIRTSDGKLTVMIIDKTPVAAPATTTPVTVSLQNFLPSGAAQRWQLDSSNTITHPTDVALAGSSLSISVPSPSITLLVIPGSYLNAPGGVVATASSTSSVDVNWTAAAGAASYRIYRSSAHGAFVQVGTS